eukprot:TRINITY_DN101411_c0_g1_i1.p1 TRINITY_DN101411_c0_g1~~TRINITY_DN101411_c0_g1_i1.p1  ORF type:complete len:339 (+),score=46.14 TRINITY_DN101411_c0_g1_i1:94-1110(+)
MWWSLIDGDKMKARSFDLAVFNAHGPESWRAGEGSASAVKGQGAKPKHLTRWCVGIGVPEQLSVSELEDQSISMLSDKTKGSVSRRRHSNKPAPANPSQVVSLLRGEGYPNAGSAPKDHFLQKLEDTGVSESINTMKRERLMQDVIVAQVDPMQDSSLMDLRLLHNGSQRSRGKSLASSLDGRPSTAPTASTSGLLRANSEPALGSPSADASRLDSRRPSRAGTTPSAKTSGAGKSQRGRSLTEHVEQVRSLSTLLQTDMSRVQTTLSKELPFLSAAACEFVRQGSRSIQPLTPAGDDCKVRSRRAATCVDFLANSGFADALQKSPGGRRVRRTICAN